MTKENTTLIAKLDAFDKRYSEITELINDPAVCSDPNKLIPLSKEHGKLRALVDNYREYKKLLAGIADAELIVADDEADDDFRSLAEEELVELDERQEKLFEQIKDSLITADDEVVDSIIIEIRAGTGGDEAALFARDLYDMYLRYAEKRRWKVEQLDFSANEIGGLREVIVNIKGKGVWSYLGYEGGGHRVQRVPQTETQGRIHTSAVTVAVLPEPEEIDAKINPDEVVEHVSRSGGPGGQSVNKLNSAIKLEHKPTGITVSMQDEKSQHKNRSKAWRILRSRVYEHFKSIEAAERDSQRKTMIGSGDRSQKVRTYNYPQNRVTDHRVGLSLYSLDKIMVGNIDEIIEALRAYDRQQRLENL